VVSLDNIKGWREKIAEDLKIAKRLMQELPATYQSHAVPPLRDLMGMMYGLPRLSITIASTP